MVISENKDSDVSKLMQKIEALEQDKGELVHENDTVRERITRLEGEIEVLEREKSELGKEIERSDTDKKSLEEAAARTDELDVEVWRLQHDLITAETDGIETNKQVSELKREVEKLKESVFEKSEKLEVLEKERALLLKKLNDVENELREGKEVGEERVNEFKKKLEDMDGRESDLIAEIGERDSEICELKKNVVSLKQVIVRNGVDMEKLKTERDELQGAKIQLEVVLEKSEGRVKEMEEKLGHLGKELEVAERVISGLKEKTLDGINGIHVIDDGEKGISGTKLQWPVLAASTGVIVTVGALWYLRAKQR